MFDFSEVKEEGARLSWVGYGISENVVFSSITLGESSKGTPRIELKVKFDGEDDSSSTNIYMYLSEAARPYTSKNILHIQKRLSQGVALTGAKFESNEELVSFLTKEWIGPNKKFRLKLKGEEYLGKDKDGKDKAKTKVALPYIPFVESMNPFSEEKAVMNAKETSLTFSKGNTHDYEPMSDSDMAEQGVAPTATASTDDLPF